MQLPTFLLWFIPVFFAGLCSWCAYMAVPHWLPIPAFALEILDAALLWYRDRVPNLWVVQFRGGAINAVSPIKETADALHAASTVPVGLSPGILLRLLAVGRRVK